MKIYTKFGDSGFTSLFGGEKVKKNDLRVEAYGTVDELNSYLGMIRDTFDDKQVEKDIIEIQKKIFTLGAELATSKGQELEIKIEQKDILFLENRIDDITKTLPQMTHFILPGGGIAISNCHIARSVCRRAERRISLLKNKKRVKNILILKYINRLSDYIFTLSRKYANDNNIQETKWIP